MAPPASPRSGSLHADGHVPSKDRRNSRGEAVPFLDPRRPSHGVCYTAGVEPAGGVGRQLALVPTGRERRHEPLPRRAACAPVGPRHGTRPCAGTHRWREAPSGRAKRRRVRGAALGHVLADPSAASAPARPDRARLRPAKRRPHCRPGRGARCSPPPRAARRRPRRCRVRRQVRSQGYARTGGAHRRGMCRARCPRAPARRSGDRSAPRVHGRW
jgi:hypothetical protein